MKKMKLLGLILLALGLTKCASLQFEQTPPFIITKATYTNWVGGVKGVSGTNVNISYTSEKEITFDSIYFRGKKTKVSFKELNGQKSVMGQFNTSKVRSKENLQMHRDASMEYGNIVTIRKEYFPFELKDTEAVLSYIEGEKTKYFKVENLQKGKPIYPN
ncbi:hypothetical protein C7447_101395 [Tenacibaculum adriaticum]|uniref:Lipoprotein n=1 Tax=Tenacibaculum adriaticum TaxID=413713 RepID=A0A5S5DUW5_9FLAO|nr:hypothetical protein [Tenacibaculum adriaticum]TYP99790.1 hypothetical protein C7447_101395 [Tenacibaculum adriaticum]